METLRALEDRVDIYLPDLKYADGDLAGALSGAPDYFPVACDAIREMFRQTGRPVYDEDGIMQRGVIVRHLVLPGYLDTSSSTMILRLLAAASAARAAFSFSSSTCGKLARTSALRICSI